MSDAQSPHQQAYQLLQNLRTEIQRVVIGQQMVIDQVLVALLARGHVLIEGVPGLGKTLLVRTLAKTFGGDFARIQFTPDLMPSDVTGHAIYSVQKQLFEIRKGPVFTHLLLADEINRAPAKTQAALLEVMQENQVTIEGEAFKVGEPFLVLATQNPLEQEGTYPLPEAQLDRFLFKILIQYPNAEDEQILVRQMGGNINPLEAIRTLVQPQHIVSLQKIASRITVDDTVLNYLVNLVRTTRKWPGIARGAGPRAALAVLAAARGLALLNGNDFVTPDDVKQVFPPALRHRLLLSPELEIEGVSTDQVLQDLLKQVPAPRN